jgi:hypothetical protein
VAEVGRRPDKIWYIGSIPVAARKANRMVSIAGSIPAGASQKTMVLVV